MDKPKDRIDEISKEDSEFRYDDEQRFKDAWTALLDTRHGRVILRDLLEVTNFGRSAFAGSDSQTNAIAGKQMVGQYIIERVNSCHPDAYTLMLKELREDKEYDRQSSDNSPRRADGARSITAEQRRYPGD